VPGQSQTEMGTSSSLGSNMSPKRPASGRWLQFWRPSHLSDGRRRLAPNLSWHDLLNRRDALVLDIRSRRSADFSEQVLVALIDTTGAPRFVAMGRTLTLFRTTAATGARNARTGAVWTCRDDRPEAGKALAWPEVHDHLVQALETAGVVLAWDVPPKAQTLVQTARKHGLSLPAIPWRDLRVNYQQFGYTGDSLAAAAKRHVNGARFPGPLARCHMALAVMKACGG